MYVSEIVEIEFLNETGGEEWRNSTDVLFDADSGRFVMHFLSAFQMTSSRA
jgi:hypothetical protein